MVYGGSTNPSNITTAQWPVSFLNMSSTYSIPYDYSNGCFPAYVVSRTNGFYSHLNPPPPPGPGVSSYSPARVPFPPAGISPFAVMRPPPPTRVPSRGSPSYQVGGQSKGILLAVAIALAVVGSLSLGIYIGSTWNDNGAIENVRP